MNLNLLDIPVYYINLDTDEEKKDSMEKMLSKLGWNYQRFPAVQEEWGCEKSHFKLLSEGLSAPFLILEDDCSLKVEVTELEVPDIVDCLYFGISSFGYYNGNISCVLYEQMTNEISRIFNMLSTHSILYLNDDYAKVIKNIANFCGYKSVQHFDKSIAEVQKYYEVYALNNPMFYQDNYNKPHTYNDLRKYSTTQSIEQTKVPSIVRPEPILFL